MNAVNPGDLKTMLDGIPTRAVALCDADMGAVLLRDGDVLTLEVEIPAAGRKQRQLPGCALERQRRLIRPVPIVEITALR